MYYGLAGFEKQALAPRASITRSYQPARVQGTRGAVKSDNGGAAQSDPGILFIAPQHHAEHIPPAVVAGGPVGFKRPEKRNSRRRKQGIGCHMRQDQ
jgi:hypothetical protein